MGKLQSTIAEHSTLGHDDDLDATDKIISTMLWVHPIPSSSNHYQSTDGSSLTFPNDLLSYHRDRLLRATCDGGFFGAWMILQKPDALDMLRTAITARLSDKFNDADPGSSEAHPYRVRLAFDTHGSIDVAATLIQPEASLTLSPTTTASEDRADRPLGLSSPPHGFFIPSTFGRAPQLSTALDILCTVYVCPFPTTPSRITRCKTTSRGPYIDAQRAVGIEPDSPSSPPTVSEVLMYSTDGQVCHRLLSRHFYPTLHYSAPFLIVSRSTPNPPQLA